MTTYLFIKIAFVAFFGLCVFGFFRFVNEAINAIRPTAPEPFGSFGWVFFKHKKSGYHYAYNAVELKLQIVQAVDNHPTFKREISGENVHRNLDLQKYLFDKAKGSEFTFKTISREEFLIAYNTK